MCIFRSNTPFSQCRYVAYESMLYFSISPFHSQFLEENMWDWSKKAVRYCFKRPRDRSGPMGGGGEHYSGCSCARHNSGGEVIHGPVFGAKLDKGKTRCSNLGMFRNEKC